MEQFERATTAAKVPRCTLAMTEQQVQSGIARGYSSVGLGFDVLMLKSAATAAIGWTKQTAI
jgi:4-hydroxy-2-oxoheptanedioate aldolase